MNESKCTTCGSCTCNDDGLCQNPCMTTKAPWFTESVISKYNTENQENLFKYNPNPRYRL